jgi:hypothetical protein
MSLKMHYYRRFHRLSMTLYAEAKRKSNIEATSDYLNACDGSQHLRVC